MLSLVPSAVFWGSLGIVTYTYAGYPITIGLLSKLKKREVKKRAITPAVSIVMAVRDEEANIERKLNNLLELDYPKEKLEIIVVSDGSTDRTDSIVQGFVDEGLVVLKRLERKVGKPSALNKGVESAAGEIVVFCDARQRVARDALFELVSCFADESVGAASGELVIESARGPGVYWKYEKAIRTAESLFDSIPGATGAFFAVRKELFTKIPRDALLDDVYTPMNVVFQGFRNVLDLNARVFDREAEVGGEFKRKARTLAGNYQLLQLLPEILSVKRNRIFFQFASHKLMRLLCPFALLGMFASSTALSALPGPLWPLYSFALAAQAAGYGLALRGFVRKERASSMEKTAYTFVALNAAAVEGLRRFVSRDFSWT